jgi:hypothetical protein
MSRLPLVLWNTAILALLLVVDGVLIGVLK